MKYLLIIIFYLVGVFSGYQFFRYKNVRNSKNILRIEKKSSEFRENKEPVIEKSRDTIKIKEYFDSSYHGKIEHVHIIPKKDIIDKHGIYLGLGYINACVFANVGYSYKWVQFNFMMGSNLKTQKMEFGGMLNFKVLSF